jgi:hypothetical protein
MRITSAGNVGIGTSAPQRILDVNAPINHGIKLGDRSDAKTTWVGLTQTSNNFAGNSAAIGFTGDGATSSSILYRSGAAVVNGYAHRWDLGISTEAMRIDASGRMLVGTSSATTTLTPKLEAKLINGAMVMNGDTGNCSLYLTNTSGKVRLLSNSAVSGALYIYHDDVNILNVRNNGTSGVYLPRLTGGGTTTATIGNAGEIVRTTSDVSLKTNIEDETHGLATVGALRPRTFNWIDEERMGPQLEHGFIAQEIEAIMPELVGEYDDGIKTFDQVKLIPLLVKAIQDLTARLEALEA